MDDGDSSDSDGNGRLFCIAAYAFHKAYLHPDWNCGCVFLRLKKIRQ